MAFGSDDQTPEELMLLTDDELAEYEGSGIAYVKRERLVRLEWKRREKVRQQRHEVMMAIISAASGLTGAIIGALAVWLTK